jgi:hypothetical protein
MIGDTRGPAALPPALAGATTNASMNVETKSFSVFIRSGG